MSASIEEIPSVAAAAWLRLRDELQAILGDGLVAVWGDGSTVHPDRRRNIFSDLDTTAVVEHVIDEGLGARLEAALAALSADSGIDPGWHEPSDKPCWEIEYVLAADVGGVEFARDARCSRHHKRNVMWAANRAHWLAGWYVPLYGATPEQLVVPPTWSELEYALGRELEHLERHVLEGDDHPYEATNAIFNGSRILHAIETGNTALSKRSGGTWALQHLPERWHDAIHAADRAYDGQESPEDAELLRASMAPFVAMVRERVPQLPDRLTESLPRWS